MLLGTLVQILNKKLPVTNPVLKILRYILLVHAIKNQNSIHIRFAEINARSKVNTSYPKNPRKMYQRQARLLEAFDQVPEISAFRDSINHGPYDFFLNQDYASQIFRGLTDHLLLKHFDKPVQIQDKLSYAHR